MPKAIDIKYQLPATTVSEFWYARAKDLIPAATQTLAKGPGQYVRGVAPKYLVSGKGAHVWDPDGNRYLDFMMAVGPLSLGYCYPVVDRAIRAQLENGITFSLMHPLEVEVAEMVRDLIPNAEMVRFSKTGADVTSAAIRLARAYTGRSKVLSCGYHGWHDWAIAVTDRNKGIPQGVQDLSYTVNYNDISSVEQSLDSDTAAVILEPVVFEAPKNNFLHKLRDLCHRNGTVLIFDEMWTGFRLALGGAQQYFGVEADLMCYSKAIANGMPLSVLAGRKELMSLCDRDVFFFTTFGGEALSLAAALATMTELRDRKVPEVLAFHGRAIREGYNSLTASLGMDYTRCIGFDCRSLVTFDATACNPLEAKSLMQQELIARGILWSGFHNMSFAHSVDHVAYLLAVYGDILPILMEAVESNSVRSRLLGDPVEPVFRRTGNFNMKPVRQ